MGLFIFGNNLTLYCLPANLKFKKIREAHNPDVAGSNPAPAIMKTRLLAGFLFVVWWVDLDMIKYIIPLLLFVGLAFTQESGRELLEYKKFRMISSEDGTHGTLGLCYNKCYYHKDSLSISLSNSTIIWKNSIYGKLSLGEKEKMWN